MSEKSGMSLEALQAYFHGVHYALLALKGRINRMENPSKEETLAEISRYQKVVAEYNGAVQALAQRRAA